jgi:hypothetical protein
MNGHIFTRTDGTGNVFERRSRSETFREFLRRQFRGEATRAQIKFDIAVGLVLPVLCLVFDPVVFRGGFSSGRPLAGQYQLFAYGFIAVEIIALAVWLSIGSRAAEWCGVLAGIMLAGALFSVVIGVCLLPFSLFGLLFFLVGALGFTPFLTAIIYVRNARRALTAARAQMPRTGLFVTLLFGATLAVGAPAFAHWRINKLVESSLAEVLEGDDAQAAAGARRLGYVSWVASAELDQVVWAYGRTIDPQRQERLARAYREITGDDIKSRWYLLSD